MFRERLLLLIPNFTWTEMDFLYALISGLLPTLVILAVLKQQLFFVPQEAPKSELGIPDP